MATATDKKPRSPRTRNPRSNPPKPNKAQKGPMTEEHKAALAVGRNESRAVNAYLEALDKNKPQRGRKVKKEELEERLEKAKADAASKTGLERLTAIQEREALQARIDNFEEAVDLTSLKDEFVKVAKSYGERKSISAKAWKEFGVPREVLVEAGIL